MEHTPGPWRLGTPFFRCTKDHGRPGGGHRGYPECEYTFQSWDEGGDCAACVSAVDPPKELIGYGDDGPVLSLGDARLIAQAPAMAELLGELEEWIKSPEVSTAFIMDAMRHPVSDDFSLKAGAMWQRVHDLVARLRS